MTTKYPQMPVVITNQAVKYDRTRQELIANNLMNIVEEYPGQLRLVVDELVSLLDNGDLDQIEDLIVNKYCEEDV